MNWDRHNWTPEISHGLRDKEFGYNYTFSNIRHTWLETMNSGPFASKQ